MSWLKDRANAIGKRADQLINHSVASDIVKASTLGMTTGITNLTLGTDYKIGYGSGAENTFHKVNQVQGVVGSTVLGVLTGGLSTTAQGLIRSAAEVIRSKNQQQTEFQNPAFQSGLALANNTQPNYENQNTIIILAIGLIALLMLKK